MKLGTRTTVRDHNPKFVHVKYANSSKIIFSTLIEKDTISELWFAQANTFQAIAKFRDVIAEAHGIECYSESHPRHKTFPAEINVVISEITRRVVKNARRLGWYQVKRIMES